MRSQVLWLTLLLAAPVVAGCESPVQDEEISDLGPEVEGLEESEYHRYGQNCLACHGGYGPGPLFSFAGTVFSSPTSDIPVQAARITITDSAGQTVTRQSNCAGNFYIEPDVIEPTFPVRVEVECTLPDGTLRRNVMGTRINRDGGCASCHAVGGPTADSPGQVFCVPEGVDAGFEVPPDCPGGPEGRGGG
ncbi:MAG: hypothetical protein IPM79_11030 [Polyangiaceae bacterium]|jgi:hypothetical protein|nr:hypothetical protein [Polyangiaceae bacterium]MBK8938153.1 hypothetical protein [Polyangiaceae bacterium]